MKKIMAILAVLVLTAAVIPLNVFSVSDSAENIKNDNNTDADYMDYDAYIHGKSPVSDAENIKINGCDFIGADSAVNTAENKAVSISDGTSVTYKVNVPKSGLYNINLNYKISADAAKEAGLSLFVNGVIPFEGAQNMRLFCYWENDGDIRSDSIGNQIAPQQKPYDGFVTVSLFDVSGVVTDPYAFCFTEGENTVTLKVNSSELVLSEINISGIENVKSYNEVENEYREKGYKSADAQGIVIEAENAALKNSRSIISKSDNSAWLSPNDPMKRVINYIGNTNWQNTNEEITWKFHVEKPGLYNFGFIYNQDQIQNGFAYRSLKIDGVTPFKEAENLRFSHCNSWKLYEFADSEWAYDIYLSEGDHILSLKVTLGETANVYKDIREILSGLRELYLSVIMITGESPDPNRDYNLYEQIDGFEEKLKYYNSRLDKAADELKKISGQKTNSQISVLVNTNRVVANMIKNIYKAEDYISDFYSNYSSLSSSLSNMNVMPLSLDRIFITPAGVKAEYAKPAFFTRLSYNFKRFFASFVDGYDKTDSEKDEGESIVLWVNWGRDQAMALNSLINTSFVPKTGINVHVELTSASIINGMLTGNAPDVALNLSRTEPVNFAIRGAVRNLEEFEDFQSVKERFASTATVPYEYKNGTYALPETQSFYIMFYRRDIFERLGLSVPETWDEFLATSTVLRMSNMETWVPYVQITSSTTVNTGIGGLNMFASVYQQNGGSFYNEDKNKCLLDDPIALSSFSFWSSFYTKYKLPVSVSFYNRFRIGITPLGISDYTVYTQLKDMAPEIDGKWGIALIPGTRDENGNIDHTVSGSGAGCAILNTSKNVKSAWEFLKWWTDADTQLLYNNEVESILGTISRIATANTEAFENMGWDYNDLEILNLQRKYIKEIPEVPGSYFVARAVDQAFWKVYNKGENVKDALIKAADYANEEIERKINAYS